MHYLYGWTKDESNYFCTRAFLLNKTTCFSDWEVLCNNVPSFAGQTANLWNLQNSVFKWTAKYSSMLSKKSKNMYTEKMIEQLFRLSYICYQFKPLQITVYLLPLSSTFTQSSTGKHWLSLLHFSPWVCKSSKHIYFHFMAAWAQCRV